MSLNKSKVRGVTLIELLIAMGLGAIVIGAVITVFSTTVRYNSDNLQMIRLNQEIRGVMSLISRDLRRAGYFNSATVTSTYLDTFDGANLGSGHYDCIYFAYDIDSDGAVSPSDLIAYKLDSGVIKQGTGSVTATPANFNCASSTVSWEPITEYDSSTTDRSDVQITTLQFEPECSVAGGTTVHNDFDCNGESGIRVRNITVTITGQVTTPVDNTVVTRTLTETIKLRNDAGA